MSVNASWRRCPFAEAMRDQQEKKTIDVGTKQTIPHTIDHYAN